MLRRITSWLGQPGDCKWNVFEKEIKFASALAMTTQSQPSVIQTINILAEFRRNCSTEAIYHGTRTSHSDDAQQTTRWPTLAVLLLNFICDVRRLFVADFPVREKSWSVVNWFMRNLFRNVFGALPPSTWYLTYILLAAPCWSDCGWTDACQFSCENPLKKLQISRWMGARVR